MNKEKNKHKAEKTVPNENTKKPIVYHTPRYHCVHLKFLTDFLRATQKSVEGFAGSYSASVVLRRQLNSDDMLLSKARELFERNGYILNVSLEDKSPSTENDDVHIILDIPDIIEERNVNIGFVFDTLRKQNVNLNELADMINVTPGAVWGWKRVDDMRISYLFRIKKCFDCNLVFKVSKKKVAE